jgi:hypothetical protein
MKVYGRAWSPSPLWGGVGEGSSPDLKPLPPAGTLPTRGRVKNAAPPHIPNAIAVPWWEMFEDRGAHMARPNFSRF